MGRVPSATTSLEGRNRSDPVRKVTGDIFWGGFMLSRECSPMVGCVLGSTGTGPRSRSPCCRREAVSCLLSVPSMTATAGLPALRKAGFMIPEHRYVRKLIMDAKECSGYRQLNTANDDISHYFPCHCGGTLLVQPPRAAAILRASSNTVLPFFSLFFFFNCCIS